MVHLEGVGNKMIANNLKSFYPAHPGEELKDKIEYRGISQRGLARTGYLLFCLKNSYLLGECRLAPEWVRCEKHVVALTPSSPTYTDCTNPAD